MIIFHDYLYGRHFTVFTDNNPLCYVLSTAKLDAAGHRWLAELSTFNFQIMYRSGKKNTDADCLSRLPQDSMEEQIVPPDIVSTLCSQNNSGIDCAMCVSPEVTLYQQSSMISQDVTAGNKKHWR